MSIELIFVITTGVVFAICTIFAVRSLVIMGKIVKEIEGLSKQIETIEEKLKTLAEKALTFEKLKR